MCKGIAVVAVSQDRWKLVRDGLFADECAYPSFPRRISPIDRTEKKKKGKKNEKKKITSKSKMETVGEGINRATLHA